MENSDAALDRFAERANLYTKRRDEMMIHAVRGLLLANGGGAAALLAFLQAMWGELDAPVGSVVTGMLLMALGVAVAVAVLLIRYQASVEEQSGNPRWRWWRWGYNAAVLTSLALFLAAVVTVGLGVLSAQS